MVHYLTIIATIDKLNFSQVILKKRSALNSYYLTILAEHELKEN